MKYNTLVRWHAGLRHKNVAHHLAASRNRSLHKFFGIPVVILSTLVGTSIFSSLGDATTNKWILIITGMLSISATVLASLQTFLNYAELAAKHKSTAVQFGMLRREVEQFATWPNHSEDEVREFLDSIRERWDQAEQEAPTLPQKIFNKATAYTQANPGIMPYSSKDPALPEAEGK